VLGFTPTLGQSGVATIPPSNQVEQVVDEVVNDDELVKDVNPISLKERRA
jgi:hypothetical protein